MTDIRYQVCGFFVMNGIGLASWAGIIALWRYHPEMAVLTTIFPGHGNLAAY